MSFVNIIQQNFDVKLGEFKLLFMMWCDCLLNIWDDIVVWYDLVIWRQYIFGLINNIYFQLVFVQGQNVGGVLYVYCGYYEMVWIINCFVYVV